MGDCAHLGRVDTARLLDFRGRLEKRLGLYGRNQVGDDFGMERERTSSNISFIASGAMPASLFLTNTKPYVDAASTSSLAASALAGEMSTTGISTATECPFVVAILPTAFNIDPILTPSTIRKSTALVNRALELLEAIVRYGVVGPCSRVVEILFKLVSLMLLLADLDSRSSSLMAISDTLND